MYSSLRVVHAGVDLEGEGHIDPWPFIEFFFSLQINIRLLKYLSMIFILQNFAVYCQLFRLNFVDWNFSLISPFRKVRNRKVLYFEFFNAFIRGTPPPEKKADAILGSECDVIHVFWKLSRRGVARPSQLAFPIFGKNSSRNSLD